MKIFISVLFFISLNLMARTPVVDLFIPWGDSPEQVKYRLEPGYRFGPQDFQVDGETFDLLDPLSQAIKSYRNGKLQSTQEILPGTKDIPVTLSKLTRSSGRVKLLSKSTARIMMENEGLLVHHGNSDLVSMRFIGRDNLNRTYVDVNIAKSCHPITVDRQIWILNLSGAKIGQIDLPHHYFTYIKNDLKIDRSGTLYHMLSSSDGIFILRWEIPEKIENFQGNYPPKFQEKIHFFHDQECILSPKNDLPSDPATAVSRQKTLEIADTYVQHEWNCRAENLTNGVVTAPDGDKIRTPDWIRIGTNRRLPYKWGGFDQLTAFDSGLLNNNYAGDNYTDGGGSDYARGVDCSGYVSRCWQLNYHYSTRMMDDPAYGAIVQPYYSLDQLKPGDAFHRHGHVILFVKHNEDGSFACVEAAGSTTDWKVDYTTHYAYAMTDYKAVYYKNMEGAILPAPHNITLECLDQSSIRIGFTEVNNAKAYTIFWGTEPKILSDSVVSTTPPVTINGLSPEFTYYFQVIARNDSISSPLSHDVYAASPSGSSEKILVVNGFDRSTNTRHDYITQYIRPVKTAGHGFSYALNESVIGANIFLTAYTTVIWILGDESSADHTFDLIEQQKVTEFLQLGGNLFVSGSEIGWDLEGKTDHATQADRDFYHNYLKAQYHADSPYDRQGQYYTVESIGSGIFDLVPNFEFDDGTHGTINVDWPDAIKPVNGSTAVLKFTNVPESAGVAGIQYAGLFPGGSRAGKLVYLTFPFETIISDEIQNEVMGRTLAFFTGALSTDKDNSPEALEEFSLSKNYPNPFNPITNFSYQLPMAAHVRMKIYTLTGSHIKTLIDERRVAGQHILHWDATNYSSGVYLYKMVVSHGNSLLFSESGKCILMK
ncbi:MAG: fibronectin type III domain-containing protein [Candidatus Marinimicrobia bacterium]|nr:fibronectin type III domain-containing protein [Candidatus Neomarinimicrobiota bacterium]